METWSASLSSLTLVLSREQMTNYTLVTGLGVFENTGVDTVSLARLLLRFPGSFEKPLACLPHRRFLFQIYSDPLSRLLLARMHNVLRFLSPILPVQKCELD